MKHLSFKSRAAAAHENSSIISRARCGALVSRVPTGDSARDCHAQRATEQKRTHEGSARATSALCARKQRAFSAPTAKLLQSLSLVQSCPLLAASQLVRHEVRSQSALVQQREPVPQSLGFEQARAACAPSCAVVWASSAAVQWPAALEKTQMGVSAGQRFPPSQVAARAGARHTPARQRWPLGHAAPPCSTQISKRQSSLLPERGLQA
jgi:hypothetical protein